MPAYQTPHRGTATMSRTASQTSEVIPGWWIEFQKAMIGQMPRPGEIDQVTAMAWADNQRGLKKVLSEALVPPKLRKDLLRFISAIDIPTTIEIFIAGDKFSVTHRITTSTQVIIAGLNGDFVKWFLRDGENVVNRNRQCRLSRYLVQETVMDNQILTELYNMGMAETTLADIWYLLEKQGRDKPGFLSNNASGNIFFVAGQDGNVRTVHVYWSNGWIIDAFSLERPCNVPQDSYVFLSGYGV